MQGSCILTGVLQRWYNSVKRALKRREKVTLTPQYTQYAKVFPKNPPAMLQPESMKLKLEAIAQVDYITKMSKLNENFPNKIYKLSSCGVSP